VEKKEVVRPVDVFLFRNDLVSCDKSDKILNFCIHNLHEYYTRSLAPSYRIGLASIITRVPINWPKYQSLSDGINGMSTIRAMREKYKSYLTGKIEREMEIPYYMKSKNFNCSQKMILHKDGFSRKYRNLLSHCYFPPALPIKCKRVLGSVPSSADYIEFYVVGCEIETAGAEYERLEYVEFNGNKNTMWRMKDKIRINNYVRNDVITHEKTVNVYECSPAQERYIFPILSDIRLMDSFFYYAQFVDSNFYTFFKDLIFLSITKKPSYGLIENELEL